jgi:hypothetical protein
MPLYITACLVRLGSCCILPTRQSAQTLLEADRLPGLSPVFAASFKPLRAVGREGGPSDDANAADVHTDNVFRPGPATCCISVVHLHVALAGVPDGPTPTTRISQAKTVPWRTGMANA